MTIRSTLSLTMLVVCAGQACGAEPQRLTDDGKRKLSPVFLPGGESVACSVHEAANQVVVRRWNLADGTSERVFAADDAHQFDVAFSGDGRYRAYCRGASAAQLLLVIQDTKDNNREVIWTGPNSRSVVRCLNFTPDSKRIVFTVSGSRGLQIASMNLQATDLQHLTTSVGTNYWSDVSPDGRKIVFSSSRDGVYDIFVMNMDGRDPRPIARSPARDIRPQWSPDGSRIAFASARGGNLDLYVMDTDGTNLRRITDHPDRDDFPAWHPDGKRLVYVAERDGRSDLWLLGVP